MTKPDPVAAGGHFREVLRSGRFALTAEISPPVSSRRDDLLAKALPLKGLADAVNVTDGAGARAHMSSGIAAAIMIEHGIEPILQFTCRDRNRIALQSDLIGAAAAGVRNILVLRGDDPGKGDQPDAKGVFDLDTRTLIELAVSMRDKHELPSGRRIDGDLQFFVGAADMPVDPAPGWQPQALRAKVAAGAQFAQTQFCMDAALVGRYVRRLADEGLMQRLHLLIGVAPLRSARSALWIRDNLFGSVIPDAVVKRLEGAREPAEEGRRICIELMQQLAQIPGVAGAHVMAPGRDDIVPDLLAAARQSGLR